MDKWEQKLLAMSEREKILKRYYENGGQDLVDKPMSYDQYQTYLKEGRIYEDEEAAYYSKYTRDGLGTTNEEVEKITGGDKILVVCHQRYSYPVFHDHAYVEILYVYQGQCRQQVRDYAFDMKEGDFCILPPNVAHAIMVNRDDTVVVNILVSKQLLDQAFLQLIKGSDMLRDFFEQVLYGKRISPYILFRTEGDQWMKQGILSMYREEQESRYAYNRCIRLYLEQIFIHLIRHYEMQAVVADPVDASMNDNIVAMLGYIAVNYSSLTLKELSDFFGYSSTHISRLLHKYTGKTFKTLITDLQMENAKKLLQEGNLSITEISQEVGCFDSSHLSHKFRNYYGMSPEEFRSSVKN